MKQVFSLLLAFVFLQVQTWAIGGGPQGDGGGAALVGTYAGVLIPVSQTTPPTTAQVNSAAVGLFGVGVPAVGLAQGQALAFVNGIAFLGDMTAVADPKYQTLVGIVEAQSNVDATLLVPVVDANGLVTYQTITSKIFAQGSIDADFDTSGGGNVDPINGTSGGNKRLTGTATLDLFVTVNADGTPGIFNTVKFRVDGFQQSQTSTTITITFNPGGGGGGGGTGVTP